MRNFAIIGITNYVRKLKRSKLPRSDPAYQPLYMGSFNSLGRAKTKALKKASWHKNKTNTIQPAGRPANRNKKRFQKKGRAPKKQPSSVIFVPNTKGGILTKKLREFEDKMFEMTGFRVKYQ